MTTKKILYTVRSIGIGVSPKELPASASGYLSTSSIIADLTRRN